MQVPAEKRFFGISLAIPDLPVILWIMFHKINKKIPDRETRFASAENEVRDDTQRSLCALLQRGLQVSG